MLVDAPDDIPMPHKPTDGVAAAPDPPFDLLFPAAYRTLAARSPLRACEALDAGGFRFIAEIGDISAKLPPGEALIVMPSAIPPAYSLWMTDKQPAYLVLLAEGDDVCGPAVRAPYGADA
jgi:hypothetical protein